MKRLNSLRDYAKRTPRLWYVLFLPLFLAAFFIVEHLVPSDAPYWVSYLPLDDRIPFLEGFILPYCLWYPYLAATGIWLLWKDQKEMDHYMCFLIFGLGLSLVFCLLFPNGQDLRLDPLPRSNFCTWLVARIYAADTNTNVFPSMHIVGCAAAVSAAMHSSSMKQLRLPSLLLALLISVSTVLVKQHSVLDILGGLAYSALLYPCIYVLPKRFRKGRHLP